MECMQSNIKEESRLRRKDFWQIFAASSRSQLLSMLLVDIMPPDKLSLELQLVRHTRSKLFSHA